MDFLDWVSIWYYEYVSVILRHTDEESWDDMRMECEKCGAMKALAERENHRESVNIYLIKCNLIHLICANKIVLET